MTEQIGAAGKSASGGAPCVPLACAQVAQVGVEPFVEKNKGKTGKVGS